MLDPNRLCMNCFCELPAPKGVCPRCGYGNAEQNDAHQLGRGSILAGTYLIGRVLGQGGFGVTYVGMDLNLECKVAIKEYYPEGCVTRDVHTRVSVLAFAGEKEAYFQRGRERFVDEAKTLAKFSGDGGIVNVRAFFHENGTAYIVMDYVEGETLKSLAARNGGRLPAEFVLEKFRPLLKSISRVHAAGLLHRDISPDNIILRPDGSLVLLDFGAARQMSVSGERSNTISVKHGFAPEEQYRTRGEQGPWTDVYALSATIYRLITGAMPPQALDRILNDEPLTPPTALGAALTQRQERALLSGLACRAADRTKTIQAFMEQLYGVAEEAPDSEGLAPQATVSAMEPLPAPGDFREGAPQEQEIAERKRFRKKTGGMRRALLTAGLVVAGVALTAGFGLRALNANKDAARIETLVSEKDYPALREALLVLDTASGKYDRVLYNAAKQLLSDGEYEIARTAADKIQNTGAYDLVSIRDEATYQQIQALLNAGDYIEADALVGQIQQPDRYDMQALERWSIAAKIEALINSGDYYSAIKELTALKEANPIQEETLLSGYREKLYGFGVECYRNAEFSVAEETFVLLGAYKQSGDYLFLTDLAPSRLSGSLSVDLGDSDFERLKSLAGFEDVDTILFEDNEIAFRYMKGLWTDGATSMCFYEKSGSSMAYWLVEGIPSGTWRFDGNNFYVSDEKGNETKAAHLTIAGANSITMYVYSTGKKYDLTRN